MGRNAPVQLVYATDAGLKSFPAVSPYASESMFVELRIDVARTYTFPFPPLRKCFEIDDLHVYRMMKAPQKPTPLRGL